ncbi:DUF6934 family protein [Dyadobacter frigoris]|uniref:Uncharacterized protein n=1 Tax=Dyadobacter frigoris TaxID=2576211 RepID=A0A4U6D7T6_9BACT|nr:hypothetical protein [Dyadobacter frigoris]TKT92297.1 hypothetical protein FDK13_09980 [Dyadobacter frigoris]GLU53481.1 hypothetical protein Dfri01_29420 [Dyadobacter frigoris]
MHIERYITDHLDPDSYIECSFFDIVDVLDSHKFYSSGSNGIFELRSILTRLKTTTNRHRLNLGFEVWNSSALDIDDLFETRNGDADEILATVAWKALEFLLMNPETEIFTSGSTSARTRLYQIGIARNMDYLPENLRIEGIELQKKSGWVEFQKGINYDAFLLSVK